MSFPILATADVTGLEDTMTREAYGGKGYGLLTMATLPGIKVPDAIVVPVSAIMDPDVASVDLCDHLGLLSLLVEKIGTLGTIQVSVRSGAPISMPGMLDTVLNIGTPVPTEDSSAAHCDQFKRLVTMFGTIVGGHHRGGYDACETWGEALDNWTGIQRCDSFPGAEDQVRQAVAAIRNSWNNERAVAYRAMNKIECEGTAIVIQRMAYGNSGVGFNCTGVAFTHDMNTGAPVLTGEFLCEAQGEDVVSGEVTGQPIRELPARFYREIQKVANTLLKHFNDAQDIEFTIENDVLYILQTRSAKRSGAAAITIANELFDRSGEESVFKTVTPQHLDQLTCSTIVVREGAVPHVTGIAAVPGAGQGTVVRSTEEALILAAQGVKDLVLFRRETSAEDIKAFAVVSAIVTRHGGMASHAAVVARGMGIPCVCGVGDDVDDLPARVGVDGTAGTVYDADDVESFAQADAESHPQWATFVFNLKSCTEGEVWVNADTNASILEGRRLGARGVGLVRTEHMFTSDVHLMALRAIFEGRDTEAALAAIQRLQAEDFYQLLSGLSAVPVTIRLLDPPLHEFAGDGDGCRIEANPMMGVRGVRLGITTGVFAAQVRGLRDAVNRLVAEGVSYGDPRVMVPLVIAAEEFDVCVEGFWDDLQAGTHTFKVGAMIETPAAVLNAAEIASCARCTFLSLGTNDLTQMTLGLSRDDTASLIAEYVAKAILPADPFATIHPTVFNFIREHVGDIGTCSLGLCGEHGGDYDSVLRLLSERVVEYVSCSPRRVPYALLANAHSSSQ